MKKIIIVAGTRPEVIKLIPVYKALKGKISSDVLFITSGQHTPSMIDPILDFFDVKADVSIKRSTQSQSLGEYGASVLHALDLEIVNHRPELVIVQGDTTTCVMGSLAAFYRGVKVAHVEAGLRTYNKSAPYPEEINRRVAALVTDYHFAPTQHAFNNLKRENVEGSIDVVGNTVVDSLLLARQLIRPNEHKYERKLKYLMNGFERMILVTGHRRENIGPHFEEIYNAIVRIASKYPQYSFVYPLHINPKISEMASSRLTGLKNIFLIDPLPYDEMVFLLEHSYLVMTDSGGLQEECPAFNKPVMVLRESTERPEGIEAGCSVLAGVKASTIINIFDKIVGDDKVYRAMSHAKNPYGDGQSAIRIAQRLAEHLA